MVKNFSTTAADGKNCSIKCYFYKAPPLRPLDAIRSCSLALEKETEGLLGKIIGGGK